MSIGFFYYSAVDLFHQVMHARMVIKEKNWELIFIVIITFIIIYTIIKDVLINKTSFYNTYHVAAVGSIIIFLLAILVDHYCHKVK